MPKAVNVLLCSALLLSAITSFSADTSIRMVRALSGPSGKVVGGKFVLDEIRNRFVYPQDNSLTVYFEFTAPKGDYTLTAYWKDPQGRIIAIAPDLKIQTSNDELNSYWILMVDAGKPSGIWTVEVRINGEPVGSHSFELVVPELPNPPPAPEVPAMPTLSDLYRSVSKSLVWLHKLDVAGHRMETYTGFVVAPNSILTAFQAVDMAARVEVEFADGRRITTDEIFGCNRLEDWALLKCATGEIPPVPVGRPESIIIGEQALVFSVGAGASRTIGAVDIAGRRKLTGFGERISTNPQLPPRAIGGPLMDLYGNAAGLIGGCLVQGLPARGYSAVEITPISKTMLQRESGSTTLQSLLNSGVLTPPLVETPVFVSGMVTDNIPENLMIQGKTQFLPQETVIVYTNWHRKEKITRGNVSIKIYDAYNRLRSEGKPQPMKLPGQGMMQFAPRFNASSLGPGLYRADIFWNEVPVWRSFFAIVE